MRSARSSFPLSCILPIPFLSDRLRLVPTARKLHSAKHLEPCNVSPALSLVGYADKVVGAIAFAFGGMLICDREASAHRQAAMFSYGRPALRHARDMPCGEG